MFALNFADEAIVVMNSPNGMKDQISAKHDQSGVENEQRHKQSRCMPEVIITGGRNQGAKHRKRENENGDACAQSGKGGSLLRKDQLNLIENERALFSFSLRSGFLHYAKIAMRKRLSNGLDLHLGDYQHTLFRIP